MNREKKSDVTSIKLMSDGPFVIKNAFLLVDSNDQPLMLKKKVLALCRCGNSANKPFCDGTHAKIGFSGSRTTNKSIDKAKAYKGKSITIHDNRRICAHVGECLRRLPAVFDKKRRPWIDADGAETEQIIDAIKNCPSGALSYTIDGVYTPNMSDEVIIKLARNGPIEVIGPVALDASLSPPPPNKSCFTLCRCGASENKPYCDGSHLQLRFRSGK